MTLTLFVTDNCKACDRVKNQLKRLLADRNDVPLYIENINHNNNNNVVIVPALYLNEELYALGDLNEEKFLKRINS